MTEPTTNLDSILSDFDPILAKTMNIIAIPKDCIIESPSISENAEKLLLSSEPHFEVPKQIECECTIEREHLSPLIRELLDEPPTYEVIAKSAGYNIPARLPRKLKKAAKGMWYKYDGEMHVKRWELAYGFKRNTKWKRRAYNWLKRNSVPIEPILRIPHFTEKEIQQGMKEWVGQALPCVVEPERTIVLKGINHD